jgi:hypothetical protein
VSASELALVVGTVLCAIGFAALIAVLIRVLDTLRMVRAEMAELRAQTVPLLSELADTTSAARETMDVARSDLARFDRVLGSAEAVSGALSGSGRVARAALSAPVIKAAGIATGTGRAWRRLRRTEKQAG